MEAERVAAILESYSGIPGVGVDVEEVDRFSEPDDRLFTAAELRYCSEQANPAQSRAGRWCAKEAVAKACDKYLLVSLREIEITASPSGHPVALLSKRARQSGLSVEISISHAGRVAVAVAVAYQRDGLNKFGD